MVNMWYIGKGGKEEKIPRKSSSTWGSLVKGRVEFGCSGIKIVGPPNQTGKIAG